MKSLARNIGAAVLGWLTMAAGVLALMAVMWLILGAEGAFQPGSWDPSAGWIAGSVGIGLFAGICGGLVAAKSADGPWGLRLLLAIVIVFGVLVAVGAMEMTGLEGVAGEGPGPRPEGVGMFDAMSNAQQPAWLTWLNPLLGVVGVTFGGRMVRTSPSLAAE